MKKRPFRSGCTTRSIPLRRASTTPVFILPRGYPSSAPHTASPFLNSACSAPPVHAPREKHVPAPAALPPQNVTILLIRSTTERLPQPPCTFLTERYRTPPSTPSCSALTPCHFLQSVHFSPPCIRRTLHPYPPGRYSPKHVAAVHTPTVGPHATSLKRRTTSERFRPLHAIP